MKAQSPIYTSTEKDKQQEWNVNYSQQRIFLIVIKAKAPNILKKDTSDALIFSMHFFLEEIKLQQTELSRSHLEPNLQDKAQILLKEKQPLEPFLKGDEVMLDEMQHLLCQLKN